MKWAGVNHTEGVMLDENGNIVQKVRTVLTYNLKDQIYTKNIYKNYQIMEKLTIASVQKKDQVK